MRVFSFPFLTDVLDVDYVSACQCFAWHLEVWKKDKPGETTRFPFRCRSWRHQGECRLWKGAQDFARIRDGMEKLTHWCHLCLTYDPKRWKEKNSLFRYAIFHWSKLRKRLIREFEDIKYIQTWEVQRNEYPHVHIAISNKDLYFACGKDKIGNFIRLVQASAVACGFGEIGSLDALRSRNAMAGYLVKLARELTGTGKDYQCPVNAPRHFRRLRASVRLLPPPIKDPDITGTLHFCRCGRMEGQGRAGDVE
jgi:hypothetical protein